jgi:hypothetical protein
VEWSIFAAGLALFCLLITVAIKIFPMLAVWEMTEEHEAVFAGTNRAQESMATTGARTAAASNGSEPDRAQTTEGDTS